MTAPYKAKYRDNGNLVDATVVDHVVTPDGLVFAVVIAPHGMAMVEPHLLCDIVPPVVRDETDLDFYRRVIRPSTPEGVGA